MKSTFTLPEIAEMLDMSVEDVEEEIDSGHLSYTFQDGEKKVTLYDLEKYMGPEQTKNITNDYLNVEEQ
jgi:hypothetical protein